METYRHEDLLNAKKAIDSLISKSQKAQESLIAKDSIRYKGQVTLLANRINALQISSSLITKELQN